MAQSPLDFPSSEIFRNRLVVRNLPPYPKSPNPATPPINFEVVQSNYSVIDSPDQLIDDPIFANQLYPLNQYGSDGGYVETRDPNVLNNTHSNEGEYGVQDANIIDTATIEANKQGGWKSLNAYGDATSLVLDSGEFFSTLEVLQLNNSRGPNAQPYPTTFVPSFYTPLSILLSDSPTGSNGSITSDSYIVRLGAKLLRKEFLERIQREIVRQTLGQANFLNTNNGAGLFGIVTGQIPLIEPNYQITVPANPITAAAQLALSLGGAYMPTSPIPGSYFDPSINPGQPTTIQQLQNAYNNTIGQTGVGQFLANLLGTTKSGSQLFLNNTGQGQKSRLFLNIDYNRYKPGYDRTIFDRLGGAIVGTSTNNSNYYIGSTSSEPSRIFSPSRALPVNEFGNEIQAPVFGPSEMAQLYEGPSQSVKLGANGPTYSDGGGIEGGFTWVSPKYKGNAGFKVGPGGAIAQQDTDFKESSYSSTESTNYEFKTGSILDKTQRIIDSQPQGGKRLQHVGNAIDQVSKVFNDGYKELTKGSRVLSYVGEIGQEKGAEYCRVFAKDTPYLQHNDLQKTDGITTEGRRFSYSVFDKTYNLNIVPNKREGGKDSTNLVMGGVNGEYAKKYMFSIENLAWRTSNRPGYTVSDLPVCERGPNGGRVMWFPPYDLKFTESTSANWKGTDFLGRPEPIYTYNNTTRSGTLSWKIVVDHPSVLNMIVNKVLANETNKVRIDSILESFFAGCRKYDLYELAKKYYTVNPNDLLEIQKEIQNQDVSTERTRYIKKTTQTNVDGVDPVTKTTPTTFDLHNFEGIGGYFGNDYPKPDMPDNFNYTTEYDRYTAPNNKKYYHDNSTENTDAFFSEIVEFNYTELGNLANKLKEILSNAENKGTISLTIDSSCSAPATVSYNQELSKRRIKALKNYFLYNSQTSQLIIDKRLLLVDGSPFGEGGKNIQPKGPNGKVYGPYASCTDSDGKGDNNTISHDITSLNAMSCRRAIITKINTDNIKGPDVTEIVTPGTPASTKTSEYQTTEQYTETTQVPVEVQKTVVRDNITKRVLRALLSECDYFETIKEETPMVYDNLREKLKFFHPSFHSTTPEGLNSRLTFLQQCLRPGDTIPVVQKDGNLVYNEATNTAFGAPPVLILRVGDFWHSKIIPDGIQLSYENLDINPEGIGIQPMIANVSLSFKFVGGQGLAGAVDRIQNALSFNYYANTEIYDDRADVTDTSYQVFDKAFLDYFNIQVPPPTVNQVQNINGQNNGQTIGVITSTVPSQSGDTGEINYQAFMNGFVDATQNYFVNILNKNKEVFKQFNNAVMQNWTINRNYQKGNLTYNNSDVSIFGKPSKMESIIDKVFSDFVKDIDNGDDELITYIKGTPLQPKDFSTQVINNLKENYKKYISTTKKNNFQSALTKIIQDLSLMEQNYVSQISKVNTICYAPYSPNDEGTDGYQQSNGYVKLYYISGTTKVDPSSQPTPANTLEELINDSQIVKSALTNFEIATTTTASTTFNGVVYNDGKLVYKEGDFTINEVFIPFSKNRQWDSTPFRRSYFILNDDIIDNTKYTTFKNALIGSILTNPSLFGNGNTNLEKEFDDYWSIQAKPVFVEENKITESFLTSLETGPFKPYLTFSSNISKIKKREFTYETIKENTILNTNYKTQQENLIKSLGASSNQNNGVMTFNDFINNTYIGKVKFN